MSAATATVAAPKLPDPASIADPRFTIQDRTGGHLLTYCPINRVGGIYTFATARWQIQCGTPFLEFVVLAAAVGLAIDDTPDARTWFESCQVGDAAATCAGTC